LIGSPTKAGYTPFEGKKIKGVPHQTIVRGKTIMKGGEVIGEPGYGDLIHPIQT
jgi:allantoinase